MEILGEAQASPLPKVLPFSYAAQEQRGGSKVSVLAQSDRSYPAIDSEGFQLIKFMSSPSNQDHKVSRRFLCLSLSKRPLPTETSSAALRQA